VLVGAAEIIDWNNRMQVNGITSKGTEIDWPALMRFKRTFTEPVPKSTEQWFVKAGIVPFHGRARFVDKTTVIVGDDTLEARYVVIATGAWPRHWEYSASNI
jgi:glutathione reductase (NADPH)